MLIDKMPHKHRCNYSNELETWRPSWWRSIVVRPSILAGELSLSCTRLMCGRVTTLLEKCPLSVNQQGQLSLPSLRGRLNEY